MWQFEQARGSLASDSLEGVAGMAGVALDVAIAILRRLFAAVVTEFGLQIAVGDPHQTFFADLVAAGAAAVTLLGDGAGLSVPGDLGFHDHPGQIVFAVLVLFHLFLVAFAAGLGSRHLRLGEIFHGGVFGAMTVMTIDLFIRLLGIGVGAVEMLFDDARCYCDMTAGAILVGLLILIEGLIGGFGGRNQGGE